MAIYSFNDDKSKNNLDFQRTWKNLVTLSYTHNVVKLHSSTVIIQQPNIILLDLILRCTAVESDAYTAYCFINLPNNITFPTQVPQPFIPMSDGSEEDESHVGLAIHTEVIADLKTYVDDSDPSNIIKNNGVALQLYGTLVDGWNYDVHLHLFGLIDASDGIITEPLPRPPIQQGGN